MSPITAQHEAPAGQRLSAEVIRRTLERGLAGNFRGQRLLILIPDHTRSLPLPLLFRALLEVLGDARHLTFMVALGTHPPLGEAELNRLVGIPAGERGGKYAAVRLCNHAWDDPSALTSLGWLEGEEIRALAGSAWHTSLPARVDIEINRAALACDHLLILGPTFPHEVVGFSGGAKYLFPGISGAGMINATHWLGALSGVVATIGLPDTPVRGMIHAAARRLKTPITLIALTVEGHDLSGIFIGDHRSAWEASVRLSAQRHIRWCPGSFQRVLSCAPPMYDELWTAAKAMYKIEPVVAVGGEVILYAPHLDTVSRVHGKYIYELGYHILPYFLADWPRFQHYPLGVLAHSTHLRGSGSLQDGVEQPNVQLTLASRIPAEDCTRLGLGYCDPATIDPRRWAGREADGILYVARAGEMLYRTAAGAAR